MLERVMRAISRAQAADTNLLADYLRRALAPAQIKALTAAATLATSDFFITGDATGAAFSITLPSAAIAKGHLYLFKRLNGGANAVTIAAAGTDTIDGAATLVLSAQNQSRQLFSFGTSWSIVGGYL